MARGRHRRPSPLLAWLWPSRARRVQPRASARVEWDEQQRVVIGLQADLFRVDAEMARLRALGARHAASAAAADLRARRAEEQLAAATSELTGLRADLASLREELVWAFAERKVDVESAGSRGSDAPATAAVIDLRSQRPGAATG
jgi:hypothetical protein